MSRSGEVGRQHLRNPGRRARSSGRPRQARHCRTRAAPRRTSRYRARSPADRGSPVSKKTPGSSAERTSTPRWVRRSSRNGAPPARIEKTTRAREALARVRQPCEVGALHLPRVADRPAPPRRSARRDGAFGLGVHEEHAAGGIDLLEERRVRPGLSRAEAPTDVPAKPSRTRHGANARSRRPTRGRRRGCPRPRRARAPRARCLSASSPRVVWSETTATSISSRSSAARRCARSWTRRSSSPVPSGVEGGASEEPGTSVRTRSTSTNDAGKRCWWRSKLVTTRADLGDELDERLELGQRIARADERDDVAHRGAGVRRPRAEPLAAKVARLRRDEQLDGGNAAAEPDLVGEAAAGERRHRHLVLDPLRLCRRDELEGDGLSEQARFGGERLGGDAELAQALGEAGPPRPRAAP